MLNPVGRRNPDSHPHESFRPYDRLVFFFLVHLTVRRLDPTGSSATTDHYGPA